MIFQNYNRDDIFLWEQDERDILEPERGARLPLRGECTNMLKPQDSNAPTWGITTWSGP